MIRVAEKKADSCLQPSLLVIESDESGSCLCTSQDGRMGGIFANRYAALREVDELVCISGRPAIVMIQPESKKAGSDR